MTKKDVTIPSKRKYLLSIDGGGIRGIIPLILLDKLEKMTGKLSREIFSFVAGTSTGAIIAAGIAAGISAERLLTLYITLSDEVFRKNIFTPLKRLVLGHMYSTNSLHEYIKKELGVAVDWTLNDVPIDIMITAKRVKDGKQWYFVKDNKANSCACGGVKLVDAVTASAAAPTYFHPWIIHQMTPQGETIGTLVDGGVGIAGNPVYQACVEAFYYTEKYAPETTTIISLGTGHFLEESIPTHLFSWFEWILGELLRSPGEQQTEITHRHFPGSLLYRLDPDLKALDPTRKEQVSIDEIKSVSWLRNYGEQLAETIDWKAILTGEDRNFRVTPHKTEWQEYKWPR